MTPTESECEAANILTNIKVGSGFIRSQYKTTSDDSTTTTISNLSETLPDPSSISTTAKISNSFHESQSEAHSMVGDLDALALAALQASSSTAPATGVSVSSNSMLNNPGNNFISQTDESGELVSYVMAPPATGSVPKARSVKKIVTKIETQTEDNKKVRIYNIHLTMNFI